MPPLTRIRIPALLELVEQQRYTPSRALVRQIDRAERLASEVDPAIAYPEDWVIFRITGFRPDVPNPRMIPGEALRADLSALVERISDRARLERASMGDALTPAELGDRWSISRKTIERYRRRGLVGRRVASGPGPTRLVFSRRAVEAFERENPERLAGAGGFERLTDDERRRIVNRAARYRARLGWTRNQIIGRLAARTGRSRETIRRTIEREAGAAPVEGRLAPDEYRAIFEHERMGESTTDLAGRFGRSRASIHRIINARRCDLLRRLDLSIPEELGAEALGAALETDAARAGLRVDVRLDPAAWVAEARGSHPQSVTVERSRALAYHALRERARLTVEGLDRSNPSAVALDRAETDLRWATLLKRSLVHAERGLILRTLEERVGTGLLELASDRMRALHRVAFETVIGVVDRYTPVRGGRLAAPMSLALGRALGRAVEHAEVAPPGRATRRVGAVQSGLHDWTHDLALWQAWLDPPPGLESAVAPKEDEVARVVAARFGFGGRAPLTLESIEAELGVSRRRAASMLRRTMRQFVRTEPAH